MQKRITSARQVETLRPSDKRQELRDGEVKGLILRITTAGDKSWSVLYSRQPDGKKRRITVGPFPAVTLETARKEALAILASIARGEDPAGEKQTKRAEQIDALTFNGLADKWLETHARPKLNPRAFGEYERTIRIDLRPAIGAMAADAITKRDLILKVRDKISARGSLVHADHTISMASRIYAWAVDEEYVDMNPAYKIPKAAAGPSVRDRVLTNAEVRAFWVGLERAPIGLPMQILLRLVLLTGQRRTEVAGMHRDELDLDAGLWTLPGNRVVKGKLTHGRTKNGREHVVPLTGSAITLVREAIALAGDSEFVFPSPRDEARAGHIHGEAVSKAMRRLRGTVLEANDITAHDLRRTLRTFLGEHDVPDEVADRVLNHTRPGVGNQHYNHARMQPQVRNALEMWATHVERLVAASTNGETARVIDEVSSVTPLIAATSVSP
jgi:integrase